MTRLYPLLRSFALLLYTILLYQPVQAQVFATSQTNGVTGLCLLCGVVNPQYAVDNNNLDNYATYSINAGLLTTSVYQTLIFPATGGSGCDSLVIRIASGNIILSVNLFAGITVQTFNGSIANNDAHTVDSTNLRLLTGNGEGEIILKPAAAFDRVKITLTSSLLGLLNAFRVYYAYYKPAVPAPVAPDSTAICTGGTAVLSATGVPGATIKWYDAATGGNLLATGNTYTVSPLTGTTYYTAAILNGCTSARKAVSVIVRPKPDNPVFAVPQGINCRNTTLTVSNYQPGINYNVRVKYTGININSDTAFTVVNSNTVLITDRIFYFNSNVSVSMQAVNAITGCRSDTVRRAFVYGGHASFTAVNADSVTICKGDSTTLTANLHNDTLSVVLIRWYDAPTGGNLLSTGRNFTVQPAVTTTYYSTAAFQCEYPVRTPVKVMVRKLPDPVYTVPEGISCGRQFLPVQNHVPGYSYRVRMVYNSFTRTLLDTAYTVVNSDTIAAPYFRPVGPALVDVYVQTTDAVSGCRSEIIHMSYNLGGSAALPAADTDSIAICRGDSVTLHAYVPLFGSAQIFWYDSNAGGNLLFTGNYFRVSPAGSTVYYAAAGYECEFPQRVRVKVDVRSCYNNVMPVENRYDKDLQGAKVYGVFPNPTSGIIQFNTGDKLAGSLLVLYNSNNREVFRTVLTVNSVVLPAHIPNGIYFIKIIPAENRKVYTDKVLLYR